MITAATDSDADRLPRTAAAILYARPLISGGFVAIEAHQAAGAEYRASVVVERRSDPARRLGHAPPVIAEFAGPTRLSVMHELYSVAIDDELLARCMAEWTERNRPTDGLRSE